MSAYLNLPTETFFDECKKRTLLLKVRIAQKQKTITGEKQPMVWHTYFQLTCLDIQDGVILRSTIPISSTLSNPWEKDNPFEDDVKHYNERHDKLLKQIEELAAKYWPEFERGLHRREMKLPETQGLGPTSLPEGEWAWE